MESGALLSLPPLQSSAWHGGSQARTRLQLQPRNPERRGWPGGGSRGFMSPPHPLPELQPNPTALAVLPFWRPLATLLLDPSRLATSHGEGAPLSSSLGSTLHHSRLSRSAGGSSVVSSRAAACCRPVYQRLVGGHMWVGDTDTDPLEALLRSPSVPLWKLTG